MTECSIAITVVNSEGEATEPVAASTKVEGHIENWYLSATCLGRGRGRRDLYCDDEA
jgi:hypothetical protein